VTKSNFQGCSSAENANLHIFPSHQNAIFACMDLDTELCYNRILASFRLLCSRYFGMLKEACILCGKTITEMKHHVETALGISLAFFQSTLERVLYGSGQGSSGSQPLWMTISIILFHTLEAQMGIRAK
jgi:hypothetical protein